MIEVLESSSKVKNSSRSNNYCNSSNNDDCNS